ncbi:MAG: hypothetical protein Q8J88_00640 [Bacteroidales bacterium]|nr:hypothetical protein [Bacteroidales bacterium]
MIFFDYAYYRVCDFYKKKKDSSAEMTSFLIVSLMHFFTILDLFILIRVFWEYPIPINFSKYWLLPLILIIPLINWNKYVKAQKYKKYRAVWRTETEKEKRQKGWSIILYLILVIGIPIVYAIIKQNLMEGKSFLG